MQQILRDSASFPTPIGRGPSASIWIGPKEIDSQKAVRRDCSWASRRESKADKTDNARAYKSEAMTGNREYFRLASAGPEYPHSPRDPPPL